MKLTKEELEQMTSNEIASYLSEMTQTDICKDDKYCKLVVEIFLKQNQI
jgi:hypothetical protein